MRQIQFHFRWLGRVALVLFFILAMFVLGVRYWVLPNINDWRPQIQQQLSKALGSQVVLGRVKANWSGLNPTLQLNDITVSNALGQQVFSLPQVNAQLQWWGVLQGKVRLTSLEARGLALDVRRASDGTIWVMGQPLETDDPTAVDANHPLAHWLLQQKHISLDDAQLRWRDEMRQASNLELDNIKLQFMKVGDRYQALLQLKTPAALASSLEVAGEIRNVDASLEITDPNAWSGLLHVDMAQVRPDAWAPWVDFPQALKQGEVSGQWWIALQAGQTPVITTDVEVSEGVFHFDDAGHARASAGSLRLYASGSWAAFKAAFEALGTPQQRPMPAPAGDTVQWRVRASDLNLTLPEVLDSPLSFDRIDIDSDFALNEQQRFQLGVRQAHIVSPAMDLVLQGGWKQGEAGTAGQVDFIGRFNRASLNQIGAHLPVSVDADAREWLGKGLTAGQLLAADVVLKGALDHFPFGDAPDQGQFRIAGRFENTDIDYAPARAGSLGWPALTGIAGQVALDRVDLRLYADQAKVMPEPEQVITLKNVKAHIPNIEQNAVLTVQGDSQASAPAYLALARSSPLGGLLDNALEFAQATGQWGVPLKLRVPLLNTDDTTVQGEIHFDGGRVVLDPDVPPLDEVRGHLSFSDSGLDSQNLTARFLGGALALKGGIGGTRKGLALDGRLTASALAEFVDLRGMKRLSGTIDYRGTVRRLPTRRYAMSVQSTLQGLAADFPAPVGKTAQQSRLMRADWVPANDAQTARLDVTLDDDIRLRLQRRPTADSQAYFDAVAIGVAQTPLLPARGLAIDARHNNIDADIWMAIVDEFDQSLSGQVVAPSPVGSRKLPLLPSLRQLRAQADTLHVYGITLDIATLTARVPVPAQWRVDISSTETAGTLFWKEAKGDQLASVEGKFDRMAVGAAKADGDTSPSQEKSAPSEVETSDFEGFDIPALSLDVRNFTLYGHALGELSVQGVNESKGQQWRLTRLSLKNDAAQLDGTGLWQLKGAQRGLSLDATVNVTDLGKLLGRLDMKDTVSGGSGTITGKVRWANMPWQFKRADINGDVKVDLRKGRFSSLNSRSAKVLELLSMQSMQRILSFDLNPNDMFREGYPFDTLGGSLVIERGVMSTNNYRVDGPVGAISLGGDVNLVSETLDLQAMVVPNFDMSGAALAGIAINPIVGVGAFLTQWLLKAPLSRAMTLHYKVSGNWDAPKVKEMGSKAVADEAVQNKN